MAGLGFASVHPGAPRGSFLDLAPLLPTPPVTSPGTLIAPLPPLFSPPRASVRGAVTGRIRRADGVGRGGEEVKGRGRLRNSTLLIKVN